MQEIWTNTNAEGHMPFLDDIFSVKSEKDSSKLPEFFLKKYQSFPNLHAGI